MPRDRFDGGNTMLTGHAYPTGASDGGTSEAHLGIKPSSRV